MSEEKQPQQPPPQSPSQQSEEEAAERVRQQLYTDAERQRLELEHNEQVIEAQAREIAALREVLGLPPDADAAPERNIRRQRSPVHSSDESNDDEEFHDAREGSDD